MLSIAKLQTRVQLSAVTCKKSSAWLQALPIPSIDFLMDNHSMHVAATLWLGSTICRPHVCQHCGSEVDQFGVHGLSYKMSEDHHFQHSALNNIIYCVISSAKVPSWLEPSGIYHLDGKRPDGFQDGPVGVGSLLSGICLLAPMLQLLQESQGWWQH